MDRLLHHHLTTMLDGLRPVLAPAERDGVPGRVAARLRVVAVELEEALAPRTLRRQADGERAVDAANAEVIGRSERARRLEIDEA
ncbi:hypothetical protein JMJ56_02650 [Belnapia sp. T18]|uniref:Uncharacterized protein n=1 Tax=Belnapia arida TaxID=2804533 RepID=A0ABS1TWS0_9PROT|nr:hypothetical protein [Belnapia arida]MBL6076888.1 hypothetical protein [Belnapia arida]